MAPPISDQRRLLARSAFHFTLVAGALAPPFRAFVAYDDSSIHPAIGLAMFAYLAVVVWWVTRQARSTRSSRPSSLMDQYVTAGVRSGAIGGVLYIGGILAPLFLWNTKIALFGPKAFEYNLIGEEWAFVWMAAIVVAIGTILGAILGGAIAVIDRTLIAIAHWIRPAPSSR